MKRNNKRGISSIVGSMFLIILTVSSLSATVLVLKQQEKVTAEMARETNMYLDSMSEKIEIAQTRIDNNKLNLTLYNDGDSAAHVRSIYIVNETASPEEQYRFDVDYLVDGRAAVTNVGQGLPFIASNDASYTLRVVTGSGNSASSVYSPLSPTALPLSLSLIPPTVTTGENVTLLYTITNNLTTSTLPLRVSSTISSSVACESGQSCTATKLTSGPSEVVIESGSFAIVKETYKIEGPPSTTVTFNASYVGAKAGNYVIEDAKVIVVSSTFSLNTGKATKPDIYLIVPGPFGDAGHEDDNEDELGLWGVVVVNPTNSEIKVSRVMATVFTAAHQGDVVIEEGCNFDAIVPSSDTEWGCPHDNQIQWKNIAEPETLQPGKSMSFRVRVQPYELGGSVVPGAAVTATVYTDIGIFTKAGYTTSMRDSDAPLANVYLTDTADEFGALSEDSMLGHLNDIAPGTTRTFHVAIADLDYDEDTEIESGARLIINVPPGFSNVNVISHNKFDNNPTITIREDGIIQIIGITSEDLGDFNPPWWWPEGWPEGEAAIIEFTATTPSPSQDSTYIMNVFAIGEANDSPSVSVGALAEIALQVNGTS